jgi:hypothetical protein
MKELSEQELRDWGRPTIGDLDSFLHTANELAMKYGVSVSNVIDAQRVLELKRKDDVRVDDLQALSYRIGVIATEIQKISKNVSDLKLSELGPDEIAMDETDGYPDV